MFSALAMAASSTLESSRLALFGVKARTRLASSTCWPRISAATWLSFGELMRRYFAPAVACPVTSLLARAIYFNLVLRSVWCPWVRKVRVGANSPSLWPTIDSVT